MENKVKIEGKEKEKIRKMRMEDKMRYS